jgi:hypothetical protein
MRLKISFSLLVLALEILLFSFGVQAAEYYVDPVNGSSAGNGSQASPWRTLDEVIEANLIESQNWDVFPYTESSKLEPRNPGAPVKAGDTIWLRSGYHGELSVSGYYNSAPIIIAAASGQQPRFGRILLRSSSNWHLRGLYISPSYAPTYSSSTLARIESHSYSGPLSDVTVEDCRLFSVENTSGWSADDWNEKAPNGFFASGTKVTLRNNYLKNVDFGISVTAAHSLVEGNTVENFAGDGMRGLGDYTIFQFNTVKNLYTVNSNHPDGFQSWSIGTDGQVGTGVVTGIVLRGNRFINYEDPNQPFRGTLQAIGCFDGMFRDWVVENNVIITDHWHGISLYGAVNCRVVNNTVIDPNSVRPGPPWIMVTSHKNGTPPSGSIVRNNLTTALNNYESGVVEDHNLIVSALGDHFVDAAEHDLRLLSTSSAIDAGSSLLAPDIDAAGTPRPQGSGVDIGAYEYKSGELDRPAAPKGLQIKP